jgi:hypothetical protein
MSDFVQWEDAQGLMGKIRLVGLTPLSINGEVHFATQMRIDHEYDMSTVGSATSLQSSTMVTSSALNGEMLLFSQPSFPDMFDKAQMPKMSEIDLQAGDRLVRIESVLFEKFRELPGYDNCDAAHIQFMAEGMKVSEITKAINRRVTI